MRYGILLTKKSILHVFSRIGEKQTQQSLFFVFPTQPPFKMPSLWLPVCRYNNDDQLGAMAAGGHVALQRGARERHTHTRTPSRVNLRLTSVLDPIRRQTEKSSRSAQCLTTRPPLVLHHYRPWLSRSVLRKPFISTLSSFMGSLSSLCRRPFHALLTGYVIIAGKLRPSLLRIF